MVGMARGPRGLVVLVLAEFVIQTCGLAPIQPIAPERAVQWKEVNPANLSGTLPVIVGTAPLPPTLRGVFWLTHQGASSALVSFGGANNDGGNLNLGYLDGPDNAYNIRLEGERTFTTAGPGIVDRLTAFFFDGVYSFRFNDRDMATFGQIYVRFLKPFDITFKVPGWMSNYSMTLIGEGLPEYPGSIAWRRITSICGIDSGETYELVQVVDEKALPIEPAWTKFVEYESSDEVGAYKGWMFYRSINQSLSKDDQDEVAKFEMRMKGYFVLFWVLVTCFACCCCACCFFCIKKMCCKKRRKRGYGDYYDEEDEYYDDEDEDDEEDYDDEYEEYADYRS